MENLRAFMLVEKLSEISKNFTTNPTEPQNAPAEEIAKNGFEIKFTSAEELANAVEVINNLGFIQSIVPIEQTKAKETKERLEILNKSNDGFYIASEDLRIRGPGDLFGIRQSGLLEFKMADVFQDANILKEAYEAAREITETQMLGMYEKYGRLREKLGKYTQDVSL